MLRDKEYEMTDIPQVYQGIFQSRDDISDAAIADVLRYYVRVYPDNQIEWSRHYERLSNVQKIYVFFLLRRAMFVQGRIESEAATPVQITDGTLIPGGSVRPIMRILANKRGVFRYDETTHEYTFLAFEWALKLVKP
jgi:hypothetical protein